MRKDNKVILTFLPLRHGEHGFEDGVCDYFTTAEL